MNTSHLKRFAQEARRKLISQVNARLELVLNTDSIALRDKASQLRTLREEINKTSKEQLVEKVAYTWFNRLMALRFMDVNDYQPLNLLAVTPREGFTLPELLHEAKQGHIPDELPVNRQHIFDLLDGRIPASNAQNEAYKELLIGACNYLHKLFPFMFERINDYTELLLPEDLTSGFSIVHDVREGMQPDDCKEVEIIGWLYQFYISEKNEELIQSKRAYKKHELAPASQLFTPKWIVQYMVDNTLGQLWVEMNPQTNLTKGLDFYISPAYKSLLSKRKHKSIEEVRFFDPCMGSGHVLSYAFELFYKIYEEDGYNPAEIPALILKNNLFGLDIDERAAQLASFVLIMKGRKYNTRFLTKHITLNVGNYEDFEFDEKFKNATSLGSLIKVDREDIQGADQDKGTLFGERSEDLARLYKILGNKYDVVVTNPPYISSSRMEASLKQYVDKNYEDTKSDLFATFVIRCLDLCDEDGLTGLMTPFVWMFISSHERLRSEIISNHFINNLIQLEYSGFDGATVPICTFTLRNKPIADAKGSYIRLSDFKGAQNQAPKTLEAIQNPNCGWFYTANQNDFQKIPGSKIGYWASQKLLKVFEEEGLLENYFLPKKGMDTGRNDEFLKFWHEIVDSAFNKNGSHEVGKWFPYNKGGGYRRWYGNQEYVLNWEDNGFLVKKFPGSNIRAERYYFKESLTWTRISSAYFAVRFSPSGFIFDAAGSSLYKLNDKFSLELALAFMNSKVSTEVLKIFNPTLTFNIGDISTLPLVDNPDSVKFVKEQVYISKADWNASETSWDFLQNELIRCKSNCGQNCADLDMLDDEERKEILASIDVPSNSKLLEDCYKAYQAEWRRNFFQLHQNEEELNRQFIEIYGLQEELTPDVPLEDITILQQELDRTALKELNDKLVREEGSMKVLNYNAITLPFDGKEIMAQLVSYAVGCMFGRYSLQKEGLILANQGEGLEDYLQKLEISKAQCTFLPDEDNIIPVLDEEWFEDDIVTRFYSFLKVAFGNEHFEQNLAFVEQQLGKSVRKYFTRDFYTDHVRRYKKRPIYWLFSTDSGAFSVLIYMHRYTQDTINNILNMYLRQFQEKLRNQMMHLDHLINTGTAAEQSKASRDKDRMNHLLMELQQYEREVIFPMATDRIPIDLDDGVLVNYNKFGKAVKEISGLNDKKTKEKVKQFDWIDQTHIR